MFKTTNRIARCSRKTASISLFFLLLLIGSAVNAQTYIPGSIVRAATDNTSNGYLDPNGDGYTSSTTAGFPGNNDVSASNNELAYQPVYPFYSEPNSDLRRGPNSRFSDYVPSPIDKASYYLYFDAANSRIYFRVRMGGIVPGAKGFTFLFDTDGKIGNSGVLADPNYKAATTGIGGNPGFEYEVDLYTQNGSTSTGIAVYNVDGQDSRGSFTQLYSVTDWTKYSQISMAATTDSGDPDYYIDFYIPLSAFGGAITSASSLRIIPTTIMAPLPAIGGPKSDIYGLPDNNYADYMSEYINMVAGTPGYSFSQFASGGTGMPNSMPCTAPPTLTGVKSSTVATTTTLTFSGSWTPLNLFTTSTTTTQADLSSISIKVYQTTGNVLLASTTISGTTNVATTWSLTYSASNYTYSGTYYVVAQGPNENACYQSTAKTATVACGYAVSAPQIDATCAYGTGGFAKGFTVLSKPKAWSATASSGLYSNVLNSSSFGQWARQTTASVNGTGNIAVGNGVNLFDEGTPATTAATTWYFAGGCSGGSNLSAGAYRLYYTDGNGCTSNYTIACVNGTGNASTQLAGGATVTTLAVPTITSPASGVITSSTTSLTVQATTGTRIYLQVNGIVVDSSQYAGGTTTLNTATTGTATISGLSLSAGDRISVSSEVNTGTITTSYCGRSTGELTVNCFDAPTVTTNTNTGYIQLNTSSQVAGSSSAVGATVTLYNSTALTTSLGTATVSGSGSWAITPTSSLVSGQTYVVRVTSTTCNSDYSSAYTYNTTTSTASCTGLKIVSFISTYPAANTTVTNSSNSTNFGVDAFATSLTVSWTTALPANSILTLYETDNVAGTSKTAVATATALAGATTATFTATGGGNLGLYTPAGAGGSLIISFANYNTVTGTYTSNELSCTSIGTVTCPNTSLSQPAMSITSCPTCTAGVGTSNVTLPAGNAVTVTLTNVTAGMTYTLRDASTSTNYSNSYTATSSGTMYIPTYAISSTVTLQAVGTILYASNGVLTSCQVLSSNNAVATVTATTNVYIGGTVFDDVNGGNINGTPVSAVTNSGNVSTQLYAYVLNSSNIPQGTASGGNISGQAINTGSATSSVGTYSFNLTTLLTTTYGTYKMILSTSATLPSASAAAASVPAGWSNTAEGLSGAAGDGTVDGSYSFSYTSNSTASGGTTLAVDFGIDGIPSAVNGSAVSQTNPGSTNNVTVPASTFSGTDVRDVNSGGGISYVHITSFPTNVTSATINGATSTGGKAGSVTYYSTSLPGGCSNCALWSSLTNGLYLATSSNGNLSASNAVQVDPTFGAVTVVMNYTVIDAAGKESSSATASQPMTGLSISGTVYDDFDGLTDAQIDGVGTNAGSTLFVNAISSGTVLGTATVASNGTYSISGLDPGTYSLVLTTSNSSQSVALPSGYVNTAEGVGTVSDGTVDGLLSATIAATSLTTQNFAVDRLAVGDSKTYTFNLNAASASSYVNAVNVASTANGANTYAARITVSGYTSSGSTPGALTGTDADGNEGVSITLKDVITNTSVVIDPSTYAGLRHGSTYSNSIMAEYAGIQLQAGGCKGSDIGNSVCAYYNSSTARWEIPAYNLSQLSLLVRNGTSSFSFNYAWKDAAGFTGSLVSYATSFSSPLPLKLDQFTAKAVGEDKVKLDWNTLNEENTSSFEIEHSTNGREYRRIGTVAAAGTALAANYSFLHQPAPAGLNYYRLRMLDLDGQFTYSPVRLVQLGSQNSEVRLVPNPTVGGRSQIIWSGRLDRNVAVQVVDGFGRTVYTGSMNGSVIKTLDTKGWAAGTYQVLLNQEGIVATAKLVVQ
jgi:hypothetical protein